MIFNFEQEDWASQGNKEYTVCCLQETYWTPLNINLHFLSLGDYHYHPDPSSITWLEVYLVLSIDFSFQGSTKTTKNEKKLKFSRCLLFVFFISKVLFSGSRLHFIPCYFLWYSFISSDIKCNMKLTYISQQFQMQVLLEK